MPDQEDKNAKKLRELAEEFKRVVDHPIEQEKMFKRPLNSNNSNSPTRPASSSRHPSGNGFAPMPSTPGENHLSSSSSPTTDLPSKFTSEETERTIFVGLIITVYGNSSIAQELTREIHDQLKLQVLPTVSTFYFDEAANTWVQV